MTDKKPKAPLIIEVDQTALPDAPSPAEAPQPMEPVMGGPGAAEQAIRGVAARGGWTLGKAFLSVLAALVMLWVGVAANDFVVDLISRSSWLGGLAVVLVGLLFLFLIVASMREIAALGRLGRIETVRSAMGEAVETGSTSAAETALDGLRTLYKDRTDLEWNMGRLEKALSDTPDAADRLALAEREVMAQLDRQAEEAVQRAARAVAAATALIPMALVDVVAALTCNLRMVREIAEIYGGRAGVLGSWRLMRAIAAHMVATGAVAVADDMIGPIIGGGVLAKLSRRFGEGVVNGTLTARVGVAAIEICRPMPFAERPAPTASALVLGALKSWRSDKPKGE